MADQQKFGLEWMLQLQKDQKNHLHPLAPRLYFWNISWEEEEGLIQTYQEMWQGEGRYQRQQRRVDYENVSDSMERLVDATNCPLCRLPRLNSKAEIDIMTHLALWASQDWKKVDRIVVGNIATASQTQRKWCTNVISKSLVTVIKLERYVFFFFWVFSFFSRCLKGHFCEELCQYSFFRTEVGGEDAGLYQIGD